MPADGADLDDEHGLARGQDPLAVGLEPRRKREAQRRDAQVDAGASKWLLQQGEEPALERRGERDPDDEGDDEEQEVPLAS